MTESAIDQVPGLVRDLYATLGTLAELFPGRRFTLDGHPVGSVGEVLVAHDYDVELLDASAEKHDAVARDGRRVQVNEVAARQSILGRSTPADVVNAAWDLAAAEVIDELLE